MKWIPDRSGRFPKRLHFESLDELDLECERMVTYAHFRKWGTKLTIPLTDDALEVMIGEDATLDMYAELEPGVEGETQFRKGQRPLVKMSADIASDPHRRNRLRTGLTHEWFHAVQHRRVWELEWTRKRLKGQAEDQSAICRRSTMLEAAEKDWLEFQAGFASCALLMPRSAVDHAVDAWFASHRGEESESGLVSYVAELFEVSTQAARWRLRLRGALVRLQNAGQTTLW